MISDGTLHLIIVAVEAYVRDTATCGMTVVDVITYAVCLLKSGASRVPCQAIN